MVEKSRSYMHQALTKGCKFLIIPYFRCSRSSTSFEEDAWLSTGIFCFTKVAIANDRAISVNANYDRCHNFATATKNPFSDHDLRGVLIRPNLIAHCLPTPFSSPEAALLLVSTKNRDLWPTQRSNACACLIHARASWARVGMGYTISIESKRQNGGRFKFRGVCFHFPAIRRKQNS